MRLARTLRIAVAGAGLLLVSLAALAPRAHAQGTREVALRLHRAGDTLSIRGAAVTVDHTIDAGYTDSAGVVRIPDLEDGGHIVEAVARGYQAYFDNFVSGATSPQPIQLELLPVLAADTAKAKGEKTALRLAGFEGRRAAGKGRFFTRAELDAATGRPLSNLLTLDAGAFTVSGPGGETYLAFDAQPKPATPCYATVVRDGLRIYPYPGAKPPDLDRIFPERLAGIEFYARAALVPAELRDAASCGALLLWSR